MEWEVRQFIKGTDGFAGAFAECLCGSPNLYQVGGRKPWNSINFVCALDGFTLADLVMCNDEHNLANGEDNNDGGNHNNSWNCGQVNFNSDYEEGEFTSISVKKLRKRQMRNFFLCLMVSQELVEKLSKGELPKNDYPCMNDPSPTFHGSSGPASNSTNPTSAPHSMRQRRATWARPRASDDGCSSISLFSLAAEKEKIMSRQTNHSSTLELIF
ncbi:hypothetical protein RHMOL_Rhmol03G0053400 [Rhododendron molle]|uniref:Uncharacterized protein n=2 Tax=Rhododendron molle TaxID=49168 RepID=A0ACC0PBX6_RHOML|nr:hypothetical protein RHMOL_Rhmol03G0053400 [Rhododendron molle]KAI8562681.1 hypothetical protein RHMOL_Rhmol03G0053400 [Rhododendron molle]